MRRLPLLLAVLLCGAFFSSAASGADEAARPVFSAPNPLTFDFVAVGATSAPQSLTVTNAGTAPLKFSDVSLGGRDKADFGKTTDTCTSATLAPSGTCRVAVTFSPSVAGTRIAYLRFADNTACPSWVNVAGSGTDTAAPPTAQAATCDTRDGSTTTQVVTTTTTAPAATTAPVSASSVVRLSSTCSSRRTVEVTLVAPKGKTFAAVKVLLHGKTIKLLKGKAIKTEVSLVGLPRGRFTLQVRASTTDGKKYVRTHHYVTCVAAKP